MFSSSSSSSSLNFISFQFQFQFHYSKFHKSLKFRIQSSLKPSNSQSTVAIQNSLRVLEWDKLSDCIASFAATPLGQQATKEQLWKLDQSYDESKRLLSETNAAVEMLKHGGCGLEFTGIDAVLVRSAIEHASRGLPMEGKEASAVASLLQFSEALQLNLKAACKEDSDWYNRFMPLSKTIMEMSINQPLVKSIRHVIDVDGSVKDSASPDLKRSRDQVRILERKLFQLMDSLVRKELDTASSAEVSNIDGRWCIKSEFDQLTTVNGLLLSSGSGGGSLVEPLSAVPLNDELQQARASVAKAEEDVLLRLTEKMRDDLDDISDLLNTIIELDVVTARAKYSVSYGGTFPELLSIEDNDGYIAAKYNAVRKKTATGDSIDPTKREWVLYLPKAYHPLLLQQHGQNLKQARKSVTNANADIRRRKMQPENIMLRDATDVNIESLNKKVALLEEAQPIPVDFFIGAETRVLIITGPNTGGKTICLKTVGLAALMAKSGVYVLSSEPVRIPWFDSIFADIGDEQSLSQSLSTFSGHLRQIGAIQEQSTNQSLVLLDEVGAGTNPLEGAALGMSLLESFAESGALLTIATTHHGELKTLKYSNKAFENACMEFDEANLKPTYKILWGVPGRSNAINIAERLGLPDIVLRNARELYGTASAEINEVIVEMEHFKQDYQEHVREADQYLRQSRELHESLLAAKERINDHRITQRYRMMKELSEVASIARSTLHQKLREVRASTTTNSTRDTSPIRSKTELPVIKQHITKVAEVQPSKSLPGKEEKVVIPEVGDMVFVASLGKKAKVVKVEASKQEILIQASNIKLRMKLRDVQQL
ncbi:hypothetical protein ACHQM5_012108 [Ranunculus cassubicifolius]